MTSMDQIQCATGIRRGVTYSEGVSTSISFAAACKYRQDAVLQSLMVGKVYLIDAVYFRGFALPSPRPNDPLCSIYPVLRDIYEVNFIHNIPHTSIVGVVWPKGSHRPQEGGWEPAMSMERLNLAVNPEYEGGMEGAVEIVDRFNGDEWVEL